MTFDAGMTVTLCVVLVSILGAAFGFSLGDHRARRRADMEVRHAL